MLRWSLAELGVLDADGALANVPSSSDEPPLLPAGHERGTLEDGRAWRLRHQQVINNASAFMLEKVEEVAPLSRRSFVAGLQRMLIMEMKEAARLLLLFGGILENVPDAPAGPDEISRDEEVQLGVNAEDAFTKIQALSEMA